MAQEIRVAPDGHAVAIASVHPDGPFAGYSVMHDAHGGHWDPSGEGRLASWSTVPADAIGGPDADSHIRVSPDGHAVAIVSAYPAGSPAAGFGIAHDTDDQRWEPNPDVVADWNAVDVSKLVAPVLPDAPDVTTEHDVVDAEVIPDHPELESAHEA